MNTKFLVFQQQLGGSNVKFEPIPGITRFCQAADPDLLSRGYAVAAGIPSNPAYASLPVDPAGVKADLDKLSAAMGKALDGGKKAIAQKNKQRGVVITMLRKLAHFVEVNCNNDAPGGSPQPLDRPVILNVDHGHTGELLAKITPVKNARQYEVRCGALTGGTTAPTASTSWASQTFPSARAAAVINGPARPTRFRCALTASWASPHGVTLRSVCARRRFNDTPPFLSAMHCNAQEGCLPRA